MALFVQVDSGKGSIHHRVSTFTDADGIRTVETECGKTFVVHPARVNEATSNPAGERCPSCFPKAKGR